MAVDCGLMNGLLLCWIFIVSTISSESRISAEHRLHNDLFANYNTDIRPVRDENNVIDVTLGFSLQHLDDLDAQKQLLRISGWLEVEWQDEYLSWNESEYGYVDRIVVPPQRVWLPSFALDNSAGEVYDLMHYNYFRVTIYSDGWVLWEPGGKFESVCVIDITYYPFDNQVCQLVFGNWVYIGQQVNLSMSSNDINTEKFPGNGEWTIVKTKSVRHDVMYKCCPEESFPEIRFLMYMQRKSLYYVINVLLPVLMLSLLELLIFILPCDSGEKISLGITIMLGFSVFALLIEESVPNTSEATPIIVIYLTCAMGTAALSVVASVIILAIHHHGYRSPPPKWLTSCIHFSLWQRCTQSAHRTRDKVKNLNLNGHVNHGNSIHQNLHHRNKAKTNVNINEIEIEGQNYISIINLRDTSYTEQDDSSPLTQLSNKIQILLNKVEETENNSKVSDEWKLLARSLDRRLFWFVSIFLVFIASLILGFIPMGKTWPELD